jgi:hypothetical protein
MGGNESSKSVVIYCSETAISGGLSIERQLAKARKIAQEEGLTIVREFVGHLSCNGERSPDDDEAGSFAATEGCALIQAGVTDKGDCVVFAPMAVQQFYGVP